MSSKVVKQKDMHQMEAAQLTVRAGGHWQEWSVKIENLMLVEEKLKVFWSAAARHEAIRIKNRVSNC